jgi:nitroreductase
VDTFLAVASKREVREYSDRLVSADAAGRILEAGRIAGSSRNRQPWRFLVVADPGVPERSQCAAGVRHVSTLAAPHRT